MCLAAPGLLTVIKKTCDFKQNTSLSWKDFELSKYIAAKLKLNNGTDNHFDLSSHIQQFINAEFNGSSLNNISLTVLFHLELGLFHLKKLQTSKIISGLLKF